MADWLALAIGNTRWHWAWFHGSELKEVWHTTHYSPQTPTKSNARLAPPNLRLLVTKQAPSQLLELPLETIDIWAVSVVPDQANYLNCRPQVHWITQLPLAGVYPTMGLDRAANLWGAGQRYGWPVLVIDAGTALTFTAGAAGQFQGGAILLGLRSHFNALHKYTANLPNISPPSHLLNPWARETPSAIQSGIVHTFLAGIHHFIHSWQQKYPETTILFTGGDGQYFHQLYQQTYQTNQNQALFHRTWFDSHLMFWGISAYRNEATRVL